VFGASLSAGHPSGALYVVAARELPAGSVIGPGDITTARAAVPSGSRAGLFRDPDSVVGRSLTVTVSPGEFIQSEVLATASSSPLRPVSLAVDSNSVVALAPGDRVDVLEAPAAGASGSAPPVTVVLRGASLISLARPSTGLLAGSTSSTVVTLGVGDLAAVQDVVQASRAGTVELVLAEPADGSGPGPVATPTPTTTGGTGGTGGTGDTSGVGG
jgi:Flp pilus assembly protein CpaB